MENSTSFPELYTAKSAKNFLRQCYEKEKQEDSNATQGNFAKKLGVSTANLRQILDGRRNLTVGTIHQIASSLKLVPTEHEYFEALALRDQSLNEEQKAYYQRKLNQLLEARPVKSIRIPASILAEHWQLPGILIYLIDVAKISPEDLDQLNVKNLTEKFKLSEEKINSCLDIIKKRQLIVHDSMSQSLLINVDELVSAISNKRYIYATDKAGTSALEKNFHHKDSFFTTCSMTLKSESYEDFLMELKDLLSKYATCFVPDETSEGRVYQSVFKVWPLSI